LVSTRPATKSEVLAFISNYFQVPNLKVKVEAYKRQRESDLTDYDDMMVEL
jgi:septum formation topological specificity factor MinE